MENLTPGQRFARTALAILAALVLVFLVAPIVVIVPLSFSSGSFFYYPLPGFSLRWYHDFFTSSFWLPSVWNSLLVGSSATVLATLLGTLAALGLWRARFPGRPDPSKAAESPQRARIPPDAPGAARLPSRRLRS